MAPPDGLSLGQGLLTLPDGQQVLVDANSVQIEVPDQEIKDVANKDARIVYNSVFIRQNTVTPAFYDASGDGWINAKYNTMQFPSGLQSSAWLTLSKAEQNAMKDRLTNAGYSFKGEWYVTVKYDVDATTPLNIKYTLRGVSKTLSVSSGQGFTFNYYAYEGNADSSIWSGYLSYFYNGKEMTTMFNGGACVL